jgi:zinc protease
LIEEYKKAINFSVEIHYSGKNTIEEVKTTIQNNIVFNDKLSVGIGNVDRKVNEYNENIIYFINKKKSLQSKLYFMANGKSMDVKETSTIEAFNFYFGGGFSGLVLQEVREYRSMAYSAGATYQLRNNPTTPGYFLGYIGTQADKTVDAAEVFMDLVRNMPHKMERIEMIKSYLEQSALTNHPDFRGLSTYMLRLKQKGIDEDPAKFFKDDYQNLSFDDIIQFHEANIKDTPVVMTIVGDKKRVDLKGLQKYGKVVMIKEKRLYSK